MPNGEQALEQDQEGEDSAEESGKWESPGEEEEESKESDEEEEVDSPPRSDEVRGGVRLSSGERHEPVLAACCGSVFRFCSGLPSLPALERDKYGPRRGVQRTMISKLLCYVYRSCLVLQHQRFM